MSYTNRKRCFSIIGVFHVYRNIRFDKQKDRKHTVIAYRISGCGRFKSNEEELIADEDSMIYIPAGVDFSVKSTAEEVITIYLRCYNETSDSIEVLRSAPELKELFVDLLKEWETGNPEYKYNRSMSILYSIFENAQKLKNRAEKRLPEVIEKGVEIIHRNYRNTSITVESIAKACYISDVYFRKLYKQHFGVSPLESIQELRFKYAKSLLRLGCYSVKEVALMSGFSDVKYFRTAFKKRFGITPSTYLQHLE